MKVMPTFGGKECTFSSLNFQSFLREYQMPRVVNPVAGMRSISAFLGILQAFFSVKRKVLRDPLRSTREECMERP
jgi:hypothetical protein